MTADITKDVDFEATVRAIRNMGIDFIIRDKTVVLSSDSFMAKVTANNELNVLPKVHKDFLNKVEWENLYSEMDNLNKAILWVNVLFSKM